MGGLADLFGGGGSSSQADYSPQVATDQGHAVRTGGGAYTESGAVGAKAQVYGQGSKVGNTKVTVTNKTKTTKTNKSTNVSGTANTVYNDANASVANNAINQFANLFQANQGITASLLANNATSTATNPVAANSSADLASSLASAVGGLFSAGASSSGTGAAAGGPFVEGSGTDGSGYTAGDVHPAHVGAMTWLIIGVAVLAALAFLLHRR